MSNISPFRVKKHFDAHMFGRDGVLALRSPEQRRGGEAGPPSEARNSPRRTALPKGGLKLVLLISIYLAAAAFALPAVSCAAGTEWQNSGAGFAAKELLFDWQRPYWRAGLSWLVSDESPPRLRKTTAVHSGRDNVWRYGLYPSNNAFSKEKKEFPNYLELGAVSVPGMNPGAPKLVEADWTHATLSFGGQMKLALSRLSPALMVESGGNELSFFGGAGQFQPNVAAVSKRDVLDDWAEPEITSVDSKPLELGGDMGETAGDWMLLWQGRRSRFVNGTLNRGTGGMLLGNYREWCEHIGYLADCPVLLVFGNPPRSVSRGADGGVTFQFSSKVGRVAVMPLFDFAFPKAEDTDKWSEGLPEDIVALCGDWVQRLLQYPVSVSETWSVDAERDEVVITDEFKFLPLRGPDDGVRFAPVPPLLAVAAAAGFPVRVDGEVADTGLLTYCGPYLGIEGAASHTMRIQGTRRYWAEDRVFGASSGKPIEAELVKELGGLCDDMIEQEGPFAPWAPHLGIIETWPVDALWMDPADQIGYPVQFLPAVDAGTRARLCEYLQTMRKEVTPEETMLFPWTGGVRRERCRETYEPKGLLDNRMEAAHIEAGPARRKMKPYSRAYALEGYYRAVAPKNLKADWPAIRALLPPFLEYQDWATAWRFSHPADVVPGHKCGGTPPYMDTFRSISEVHDSIAGLIGLARLAERAGDTATSDLAQYLFAKRLALRFAMTKFTGFLIKKGLVNTQPYKGPLDEFQWYYKGKGTEDDPRCVASLDEAGAVLSAYGMSLSPRTPVLAAFDRLTPELGWFLKDHCLEECRRIVDYMETISPYIYAAYHQAGVGAAGDHIDLERPEVGYSLFLARCWILGTPAEELSKPQFLDYPRLGVADWFYMSKLAETIKAYRGWEWKAQE